MDLSDLLVLLAGTFFYLLLGWWDNPQKQDVAVTYSLEEIVQSIEQQSSREEELELEVEG